MIIDWMAIGRDVLPGSPVAAQGMTTSVKGQDMMTMPIHKDENWEKIREKIKPNLSNYDI